MAGREPKLPFVFHTEDRLRVYASTRQRVNSSPRLLGVVTRRRKDAQTRRRFIS